MTGNSWGCDDDGKNCCVGCGKKQEEFYSCSDITITGVGTDSDVVTSANTTPISATLQPATVQPVDVTCFSIGAKQSSINDVLCRNNCAIGFCPMCMCKCAQKVTCHAVQTWKNVKCLNDWCEDNCLRGSCPREICECD